MSTKCIWDKLFNRSHNILVAYYPWTIEKLNALLTPRYHHELCKVESLQHLVVQRITVLQKVKKLEKYYNHAQFTVIPYKVKPLRYLEWKIVNHVKTSYSILVVTLPINKATICRKRFAIEWITAKTFSLYSMTQQNILISPVIYYWDNFWYICTITARGIYNSMHTMVCLLQVNFIIFMQ